jgi:plasmid stabilization system protein ParE
VSKTLIVTPQAEKDLDDAYLWYEDQNRGLGKEFIRCVDAKIASVLRNPLHYQIVFGRTIRRALVARFPFSVYFINEDDSITIFAILHQRRTPESWESRV